MTDKERADLIIEVLNSSMMLAARSLDQFIDDIRKVSITVTTDDGTELIRTLRVSYEDDDNG